MEPVREFRQVGKPAELIEALGKLWGQDKVIEEQLRKNRKITIIVLVLLIPGAFLFFIPWIALIPAAIYFGRLWYRYHKMNLDDRRILTPLKFLEVLQTDIPPRDPVKLVVSFEDYRKHGKALAQQKIFWSSVKRSKYEDTWLHVEGWLAEKTRFRLLVTQRVGLTEKRKRKYTKRSERVQETVTLHVRPNPKLYPALDRFPVQFAPQEMVAGLQIVSARTSGRSVLLVAETGVYRKLSGRGTSETGSEHLIQGHKLLMLMVAAFERLNRCRATAA